MAVAGSCNWHRCRFNFSVVVEAMARTNSCLILILLLFPAAQAAQPELICLPLYAGMSNASQTYPTEVHTCYSALGTSAYVATDDDDRFPCDQQVRFLFGGNPSAVAITLPPNYNMSDLVRLRVMIIGEGHIFPDSPPTDRGDDSITVQVFSQDDWGVLLSEETRILNDLPEVIGSYTVIIGINVTYSVWFVDVPLLTESGMVGGFANFRLNNVNTLFQLASMQAARFDAPLPDFCPVPNTTNPPTSTPWPSPTVGPGTPTNTPFPTGTLYPTGTIAPTFTPGSFPTIPAENTPTPMPTVVLPPVIFPTVFIATPPPLVTATPDDGGGGYNFIDPISGAATAWAGVINAPATFAPDANTGLGNTNEVIGMLVAPPTIPAGGVEEVGSIQEVGNSIATLISFIKSVQLYLPRTWPMVMVSLAVLGLILFTYTARFAVRWAVALIEWIRRLWEAIPLN